MMIEVRIAVIFESNCVGNISLSFSLGGSSEIHISKNSLSSTVTIYMTGVSDVSGLQDLMDLAAMDSSVHGIIQAEPWMVAISFSGYSQPGSTPSLLERLLHWAGVDC